VTATFDPADYIGKPITPGASPDDLLASHALMSARMLTAASGFAGPAFATALRSDLESATLAEMQKTMGPELAAVEHRRWLRALEQEMEDAERVGSGALH